MKIIITENQLRLIKEAVGVPEGIMQAAEKLYDIVTEKLKSIRTEEKEYNFDITDVNIRISDISINHIILKINIHKLETYAEKLAIASMGVSSRLDFDEGIMMQIVRKDKKLYLEIDYVVPENWNTEDLYHSFTQDEDHNVSILAHELKHKYDKTKKSIGFVGDVADYKTYSSGRLGFDIPVLDKFMRYSYFIQAVENLVRPTEISTRMLRKGITKKDFYNFITNDITYKELKDIKNFSYEYLIDSLRNEMDQINNLFEKNDIDPSTMTDDEKIKKILEIVYINLANVKVKFFDNYFYPQREIFDNIFGGLLGSLFGVKPNPEKEKIKRKFINHITKYADRELDFFKDECERFNYVATKLMKKISKIYSLIPDEKEQTNESILNWDLHQKLMEKKYGKRPIQTSYNFKK